MAAKKPQQKSSKAIKKTTKAVVNRHDDKKTIKKVPLTQTAKASKIVKAPVSKVSSKAKEIFKGYYQEGDRIFLRKPRKFSTFPDLLALQKK